MLFYTGVVKINLAIRKPYLMLLLYVRIHFTSKEKQAYRISNMRNVQLSTVEVEIEIKVLPKTNY